MSSPRCDATALHGLVGQRITVESLDQMLERAAETVGLGDHELVAGAFGDQQRLVRLWASGEWRARRWRVR